MDGVTVLVDVGPRVLVSEGVAVGVAVNVTVREGEGLGVDVWVGVLVRVGLALGVALLVAVGVAVAVDVRVGVAEGVFEGVTVNVGLGQPPVTVFDTVLEVSAGGGSSESIMAVLLMGLQTPALTMVRKLTLPVLPQAALTFQVRLLPETEQVPQEPAIYVVPVGTVSQTRTLVAAERLKTLKLSHEPGPSFAWKPG